jgi:hypothetical protein
MVCPLEHFPIRRRIRSDGEITGGGFCRMRVCRRRIPGVRRLAQNSDQAMSVSVEYFWMRV